MIKKRTILVTGGAGFIGSSLAAGLIKDKSNYVVIVDNMLTGDLGNIPEAKHNNLKFIQCDVNKLNEITSVFHSYKFDWVFHYAAVVGVQRTLDHPIWVLNDIEGIRNVLDLSKNTGVKRVFYASSSEVYGEPVEFPQNEETTPLNSRLPYAIVKNSGEAFLKSYKQAYNLDYTVFRFFNTFGPNQNQDFVVSKFINAAIKGEDLTIFGDGTQTRTFCYIEDHVQASINAAYNDQFVNDIVNIGNDGEIFILDLAKMIINLTGSSSKIVHLPSLKEGDMTRRNPDITKMRSLLGREFTSLEQGIVSILENKYTISVNYEAN